MVRHSGGIDASRKAQELLEQPLKVQRPQPRHGIPAWSGLETRRAAAWVRAVRDVVEDAFEPLRVDLQRRTSVSAYEDTYGRVSQLELPASV